MIISTFEYCQSGRYLQQHHSTFGKCQMQAISQSGTIYLNYSKYIMQVRTIVYIKRISISTKLDIKLN